MNPDFPQNEREQLEAKVTALLLGELSAEDAAYILDQDNIIRFVYVTDLSVGRSPEEVLRVLDGLQSDELCPCNWQKGEATLKVA